MAFRRDGKKLKEWSDWVSRHRGQIEAAGIPSLLVETEAVWIGFLQHGFYDTGNPHADPLPWFRFKNLSAEQKTALKALLAEYPEGIDTLVGWQLDHPPFDESDSAD